MKLSLYKKGLLSSDFKEFSNSLQEFSKDLLNDIQKYSSLKKLSKLLIEYVSHAPSDEIINEEYYRIVSKKYSLQVMVGSYIQQKIDEAEQQIDYLKDRGMYTSVKNQGKSPEQVLISLFVEKFVPEIVKLLSGYTDETKYGFKSIFEIKDALDQSNIKLFLKNTWKLAKRENEEVINNTKYKESFDIDNYLSSTVALMERSLIENSNTDNLYKKISVIHIPLFHKEFPSLYLRANNMVLVSEYIEEDIKYMRFLSEFGFYCINKINLLCANKFNDNSVPKGFNIAGGDVNEQDKLDVFLDLFSYKLMENTTLENKHTIANEIKKHPISFSYFLKDASYFDILKEEI